MPDMERVIRSLELHVTVTPAQRAYCEGKHAGLDLARKQFAVFVFVVAVIGVAVSAYFK